MKPASAKAKGRRLALELRDAILAALPGLTGDDVRIPPSCVPGEDLWLSARAAVVFPFAVEAKNQERLNLWAALAQAEAHAEDAGKTPLVVCRRNRGRTWAALPVEAFLALLAERHQGLKVEARVAGDERPAAGVGERGEAWEGSR